MVPTFFVASDDRPSGRFLLCASFLAACLWGFLFLIMGQPKNSTALSVGAHRATSTGDVGLARAKDPVKTDIAPALIPEVVNPDDGFAKAYFGIMPVLKALDQNGDRMLSASEIEAAPAVLTKVDRNNDGSLNAEECGATFGEANADPSDLVEYLMVFDKNRDGRLDRSELPARLQAIFARAGVQDGAGLAPADLAQLAARSLAPGRLDPAILARARLRFMRFHPVLSALDADHDGVISAAELKVAARGLRTLDRNGDGRLKQGEILPGALERQFARAIALDRDFDGHVTAAERRNPLGVELRTLLDAADRNGDGVVSERELLVELKRQQLKSGRRQD